MKKLFCSLAITVMSLVGSHAFGQTSIQSGSKVSSQQLKGFYDEALNASKVTPNLSQNLLNQNNNQNNYMNNAYPLWRCEAWPAAWNLFGNHYFWIGPNVWYARYRVLNACTYVNGFECLYRCYRVQ